MFQYILRRLIGLAPTLFGVTVLIFLLLKVVPGDPARMVAGPDATLEDIALIRAELGLDDRFGCLKLDRRSVARGPGHLHSYLQPCLL